MERAAWTDERLDDLSGRIDSDIRDLRAEMRTMRLELVGQIDALRLTMLRVGGGIMVGLVGVIGAVLVSA